MASIVKLKEAHPPKSNFNGILVKKIIRTAALTQAATTTTKYESPEPEGTVSQSADVPQHRSSGEEYPEHGQVQEARLNRAREQMPRNWREAAMADEPVVTMSHTIRIRTKGSSAEDESSLW